MRIKLASLAIVSSLVLGGCAYGGLHGGLSLGYGTQGYYDPRYHGWYGPSYWGWYDGFYYPGTGIYVYDRWRQPRVWSDLQQRYWLQRRELVRVRTGDRFQPRTHWGDFTRERPRRVTADRPHRQRQADGVPPRRERAAASSVTRPERVQRESRDRERRTAPRSWSRERGPNVDQIAPVEP